MAAAQKGQRHEWAQWPRFLRRFRRTTIGTFTAGNGVTLYRSGGAFFPALLAACAAATRFIVLEFYIVRDDRIGRRVAEELGRAAARGVQVLLLYDYVGSFDTPGEYFRQLERSGVRCAPFNPPALRGGPGRLGRRTHRKIVVVDGDHAFIGGMNIGDEYTGYGENMERWRDLGVGIRGPAAAVLHRLFLEHWHGADGVSPGAAGSVMEPAPCGDAGMMIVSGSPHQGRSFIHASVRLAIAGATTSVKILNPYFIPGVRVLRALLRAARRGVAVQLVLPSVSDVPLVRLVSRSYLSPLLRAGVAVYERQGTVLHAKLMFIDDHWAVIGSANLDPRSLHRNAEVTVTVDSRDFARQVAEMFEDDLRHSRRVTLQEHEGRGWASRLLEFLLAPLGRFL